MRRDDEFGVKTVIITTEMCVCGLVTNTTCLVLRYGCSGERYFTSVHCKLPVGFGGTRTIRIAVNLFLKIDFSKFCTRKVNI